jgi:SPX domain protein involved in polyphosphate accumulation
MIDYRNVVYMYIFNVAIFSYRIWSDVTSRKMDETGDHHAKQNEQDPERQVLQFFSHMQNLDPIYTYIHTHISHMYIHVYMYI